MTAPSTKTKSLNVLARPNETIALAPALGQKITYLQRALYASLLYISKQQGDRDRYQAFLCDIAALASIQYGKNSKYVRESLDQIRNLTFKLVVQREIGTDLEVEESTIGYIDRPGSIVRNGVETRIFWSLDPSLKNRLLRPENNFTLMPLDIIALFKSGSSLALAEICYMYQTNFAGKGFGTTGVKPLDYWYPRILGHHVGEKYQYKYFKRDVLTKAVNEINKLAPFRVEFHEHKAGKTVKSLEFSIYQKPSALIVSSPADLEGDKELLGDKNSYLVQKILNEVGGTRKDALEILRKYTDADYVEKHLRGHAKQAAGGYKPRSSIASFKSRIKNDWEGDAGVEQATHASQRPFPESSSAPLEPAKIDDSMVERTQLAEMIDAMGDLERKNLFTAFLDEGSTYPGVDLFKKRGYKNAIAKNFLIDWVIKRKKLTIQSN